MGDVEHTPDRQAPVLQPSYPDTWQRANLSLHSSWNDVARPSAFESAAIPVTNHGANYRAEQLPPAIRDEARQFLDLADSETRQRAQKILETYPQHSADVLRTVATFQADPATLGLFLDTAEVVDASIAVPLFAALARVSVNVQDILGYLKKNVPVATSADHRVLEQIRQQLLRYSTQLLNDVSHATVPSAELADRLDSFDESLLLFAAAFRTLREQNPHLSIEAFANVQVEWMTGDELYGSKPQLVQEMQLITAANYADSPEGRYFAKSGLDGALGNRDSEFYTVQLGNRLIAFMRFDTMDTGRLYWGSVNVLPALRGSKIGGAMFDVLDERAKHHVIQAHTSPSLEVVEAYLRNYGFMVSKIETVDAPTKAGDMQETRIFELTRDDTKQYRAQHEPTDSIIQRYQGKQFRPGEQIHQFTVEKLYDWHSYDNMLQQLQPILAKQQLVISAYRQASKDSKTYYVVLEPANAEPAAELDSR